VSAGTLAGLLAGEGLQADDKHSAGPRAARGVEGEAPTVATPATSAPELPFDVVQMLRQGIRVRPAEFARMVGVSRATVTGWKKAGYISVGPDGRLNPHAAARQLSERADPARLRAPLLRQVMESTGSAQARAERLAGELAKARAELAEANALAEQRVQAAAWRERDAAAVAQARFLDALVEQFREAINAAEGGHLSRWLEELSAVEFFGLDLEEYRADCADEDTASGSSGGAPE
jgi:hypothetical protein